MYLIVLCNDVIATVKHITYHCFKSDRNSWCASQESWIDSFMRSLTSFSNLARQWESSAKILMISSWRSESLDLQGILDLLQIGMATCLGWHEILLVFIRVIWLWVAAPLSWMHGLQQCISDLCTPNLILLFFLYSPVNSNLENNWQKHTFCFFTFCSSLSLAASLLKFAAFSTSAKSWGLFAMVVVQSLGAFLPFLQWVHELLNCAYTHTYLMCCN